MPTDKKRKRAELVVGNQSETAPMRASDLDTAKPTAVFTPAGPRTTTLSIALPGSIIANAKSHDQKTYLAGSLARAFAVFCVDEVIIFEDQPSHNAHHDQQAQRNRHRSTADNEDSEGYTALSSPSHFLAHLLSFLETPPHLRKVLFPMHPNLRTAGTLPSLDMPHHLRSNEWCPYREGVTTRSDKRATSVDVGLGDDYLLPDVQIPPNTRVTLRLPEDSNAVEAEAVAPATPREEGGFYWGYTIRRANSLSTVFTECPYDSGYDISFGTSERGTPISEIDTEAVPRYKHMLLVFGGVAGLETAAKNDAELQEKGIGAGSVGELFDYWVNLVPGQGSRTIRTEEAVWCGLMGLREVVESREMES